MGLSLAGRVCEQESLCAVLFMTSNNAFCSYTVLWLLFLIWILVKHLNKFKDKMWSRDRGGLGPQKQRSFLLALHPARRPPLGTFPLASGGCKLCPLHPWPLPTMAPGGQRQIGDMALPLRTPGTPGALGEMAGQGLGLTLSCGDPSQGTGP